MPSPTVHPLHRLVFFVGLYGAVAAVAGFGFAIAPLLVSGITALVIAFVLLGSPALHLATSAWGAPPQAYAAPAHAARPQATVAPLWDDVTPPSRAAHAAVVKAFDEALAHARDLDPEASDLDAGIPSVSPEHRELLEVAEKVATRCDEPVLFLGPTGSGKSEIVRRFGNAKRRALRISGDTIYVNCAIFKDDPNLTSLVGHVAGAYTGALAAREGLLALARNGLLVFDEIGDLDPAQQVKLFTIIETKKYRAFGSDEVRETNACFAFATNQDPLTLVRSGRFRPELLARIDTFTLRLLPLSARREDIPANLDFELKLAVKTRGLTVTMTPAARAMYLQAVMAGSASWPDNFRGLHKSVTRMAVMTEDGRIDVAHVEVELAKLRAFWAQSDVDQDGLAGIVAPAKLAELTPVERATAAFVVRVCRAASTLADAARELFGEPEEGEKPDGTKVRRALAKVGLTWEDLHRDA